MRSLFELGAGTGELMCRREREPGIRRIAFLPEAAPSGPEGEEHMVETIRDRLAGLDVHRDRVVACLKFIDGGGRIKTVKRFVSPMTVGVGELADWLGSESCRGRTTTRSM